MNLVTGGAGFIGAHLVARLVKEGEPVRVLDRPDAYLLHLPLDRIELVKGDVRDRGLVRASMSGCRRVYHLAANPNLWARDRREFHATNYLGTVHVLEEALDAGVRRILYTSTESILACRPPNNGEPIETVRLRSEDMVGDYCRSKFLAEEFALDLARRGAPIVVVNPTLPIGPGDRRRTPPTRMSVACSQGRLPFIHDFPVNVVDARDIAEGMAKAMEQGQPGRRYLLGGWNLRLSEYLAKVARASGRTPPRPVVPFPVALAAAAASELFANVFTGSAPMATIAGVRLARRSFHFDVGPSLEELDLAPRPVEQSVQDAIHFYHTMKWI